MAEPSDDFAGDVAFDHVVVATGDPDGLRAVLERDWGLRTVPGNRFSDGVSADIVPLEPPQYLEIIHLEDPSHAPDAFDDEDRAAFASLACLVGVALRTTDLDRVAALLGRSPTMGSGVVGHEGPPPWSYVADETAHGLPWYIEYHRPPQERLERHLGELAALGYERPPGRVAWAAFTGDPEPLGAWAAPAAHLDVRTGAGAPSSRVGIRVGDRTLIVSSDPEAGLVVE